jgi:hypothetical protein
MTTICMFTAFASPAGMGLAKALLGAGYGLTLVETGGVAPSGAAAHWTDATAVLAITRNADLVVYWSDPHDAAPGNLAWMPRVPGVMCIDGANHDGTFALAAGHAAGIITTEAHPWLDGCTVPVQQLTDDTPQQWVDALATLGPQAMLALPMLAALRQFDATLANWQGTPDALAAPAMAAPLDVLRSGRRFL